MQWKIDPYEGTGPIKLGMKPEQVQKAFRPFEKTIERSSEYFNAYFPDLETPILGFRNGLLVDFGFGWRTEAVYILDTDYFHTKPNVFLQSVKRLDSGLKKSRGGNILSSTFGISFDLIDLDESDKTIWAFSHEEFVPLFEKARPFED